MSRLSPGWSVSAASITFVPNVVSPWRTPSPRDANVLNTARGLVADARSASWRPKNSENQEPSSASKTAFSIRTARRC